MIVVVVTDEKYWDAALWDMVRTHLRDGRALVVVQTRAADPSSSNRLGDVKGKLQTLGLLERLPTEPQFLHVDSVVNLDGHDGGIGRLKAVLRDQIARNARRRVLAARIIESYRGLVLQVRGEIESTLGTARALNLSIEHASKELEDLWISAILDRLPEIMPRLRVHFDDQLASTMVGTAFGRALEVIGNSLWLFSIVPAMRAQGWWRLIAVGGAATAALAEKAQREIVRDTPWLEGVDLEPDPNRRAMIFDRVEDAQGRFAAESGHLPDVTARRSAWEQASSAQSRAIGGVLETQIRLRLAQAAKARARSWGRLFVNLAFLIVPAFGVAVLAKNYFWDLPVNGVASLGVDFVVLTLFLTVVWALIIRRFLLGGFTRLLEGAVRTALSTGAGRVKPEAILGGGGAETKVALEAGERLEKIAKSIESIRQSVLGSCERAKLGSPAGHPSVIKVQLDDLAPESERGSEMSLRVQG